MSDPIAALAGKVVVVTGATGFIGGAVARRLRGLGAQVHGISRSPQTSPLCDRWWRAELTDEAQVRALLGAIRPSLVFDLAGLANGGRGSDMVLPTLQANLLVPVNLLLAAREHGCRVLFAGSMEEAGPESAWPVPRSPYSAAKFAAGAYARMFHALYQTPMAWLRIAMAYGPAQPDSTKVIPYVISSLLRGEAPDLSSGTRLVDWIYIDDVVEAFLAAAVAPDLGVTPLDVGSGELVTVRAVVEELARIIGSSVAPRFEARLDRPLEKACVADLAPTAAVLRWSPRVSLQEGLARTVEWYREHGFRGRPTESS